MKSALIKRTDDRSSAPSVANELNFEPRRPLCASSVVHNSSVRSQRDPLASRVLRLRVFDRAEIRASNSRGTVTAAIDRESARTRHHYRRKRWVGANATEQRFFRTQNIPLTVCCTLTSGHSKSIICESQTTLSRGRHLSQRQFAT